MMDPLTVDVIVDAPPAELIERAYHYGIVPAMLAEGVADPDPGCVTSGEPLTIPDSWLVAA